MARCPFATWRPLTENQTQGRINPTQVILHTAVDAPGPTSLFGFFERHDVTVESTFYIRFNGEIEQYLDTTVRADANATANVRAISIETEDDGSLQPWSSAQMASIKRLGEWIMQVHPAVTRRVCPHHDQSGWGYHSMWGAPSPWTPVAGKTCPGAPRILQFKNDIRPWLAGPPPTPVPQEDDDMFTVIGVPGDETNRPWAALCDGYVRIFFAAPPANLDAQTVWCPNEEYNLGVGTYYKAVKSVDARTYDVLVATAKRKPA